MEVEARSVNDIPRGTRRARQKKFTFLVRRCSSGSCTPNRVLLSFGESGGPTGSPLAAAAAAATAAATATSLSDVRRFSYSYSLPLHSSQTSFLQGISFWWNLLPRDSSRLVSRPSNLYLVRFPSPFISFSLPFSSFIFFSSFFFHPVNPTASFVFLRFRLRVWQVMYQVHRMRS